MRSFPDEPSRRASRTSFRAALALAAAGLAALASADARGADQPVDLPLTFARAVAEGARRAPAVNEAATTRAAAADFAASPGAALPSVPQVTMMAGARDPRGLPIGPEFVVSVQQEIAARALGRARRRAADWAARAATSELDRARLLAATTAALAWLDLLEAQELERVRSTARADAEKLERLAEVRVLSGVASPAERSLARAEVGSAELAVLDGEGRAVEARLTLALATGHPLDARLRADGTLDASDGGALDARAVLDGLASHPAVRAADAYASHASAEADVVHAALGPAFAVGLSAWSEGTGDRAATAVVTVPLTLFDPARYDRGRQVLHATALSAYAQRARIELEHEARSALHEHEHTREVRVQLRDGVVAPLRKAVASAVAAYGAGTTDLAGVLLARRSLLSAEERLVIASADVARADVRVAALAGTLGKEAR